MGLGWKQNFLIIGRLLGANGSLNLKGITLGMYPDTKQDWLQKATIKRKASIMGKYLLLWPSTKLSVLS